jgi:SARP family transcriptional regulator, regulator of embCAB operon
MNTQLNEMSIGVIGPLTVELDGTRIVPAAAKPRQILALLSLSPGSIIGVPVLRQELWGECPPRSASTTLQTYIRQLRVCITAALDPGQDPKQVLRTDSIGYTLQAHRISADMSEFEQLAQAGRAAAEDGDHYTASARFGRALALWRGQALADVRPGWQLGLKAASLEQARLSVHQRRIDSDLALGRHVDLLAELNTLVVQHPTNEHFCASRMTALYSAGYIERALGEFHRLRTALRDELGIEPTPMLQRLHLALLSGTAMPGLMASPRRGVTSAVSGVRWRAASR